MNMSLVYLTSTTAKAGKTLFCAGLGKTWTEKGKKVGYLKLLTMDNQIQNGQADKDILFMQNLLGLQEPVETLGLLINPQIDPLDSLRQTCGNRSEKDLLLIEGLPLDQSESMITDLNLKTLVIHDYSTPLTESVVQYQKMGTRLMGVILNKVPRNQIARVKDSKVLSQAGLNLLGIMPEDRFLMSPSVNDLAEIVQGKILNSQESSTEIIENFMMGSSTFDRGPAYYNRKTNKAVILWGERPGFRKAALAGLQSAALQTSVKCVVIGNNGVPIPAAAQKAEEKKVPLISAGMDLKGLISLIENNINNLKFNQEKKLPRLQELMVKIWLQGFWQEFESIVLR
jgi:BioD-like phosphotransacetylase family protein